MVSSLPTFSFTFHPPAYRTVHPVSKPLFPSKNSFHTLEQATNVRSVINCLLDGWLEGYIEDDGYVAKPVKYLNMINPRGSRVRDITKVFIDSLNMLPDGNWVVEYAEGAKTHFVVANRRGIVFDPSYPSLTCAKGKVFSYRKLLY